MKLIESYSSSNLSHKKLRNFKPCFIALNHGNFKALAITIRISKFVFQFPSLNFSNFFFFGSLSQEKIISPWDEVSLRLKLTRVVEAEKVVTLCHFPLDPQSFPSEAKPSQVRLESSNSSSQLISSTRFNSKSLPWLKEKLAFYFLVRLAVFLCTM